ncbi:MAG: transposase [Flavobacteriales bacterium]|nr:transposase [Flavobacteriales bacterium]
MKERRSTAKKKLRIVQEAADQGSKVTLDTYRLYPATYYDWKRKLQAMEKKRLGVGRRPPKHLKEIRRLGKQNQQLKQLLAEQQLESKLKDELLKKKYPWARGKN